MTAFDSLEINHANQRFVFDTGYRVLHADKLYPLSLEGMLPGSLHEYLDSRVLLYLEVLSQKQISSEDALNLLEWMQPEITKHRREQKSTKEIYAEFKKYHVEPNVMIQRVKKQFINILSEMLLPSELLDRTTNIVNTTQVILDEHSESSTSFCTPIFSGLNLVDSVVNINLNQVINTARTIAKISRTEVTETLLKLVLATDIGHETAHVLDLLTSTKSKRTPHYVSKFIQVDQRNFPIKLTTDASAIAQNYWVKNNKERFAVFFEQEVVERMLLPIDAFKFYRNFQMSLNLYVFSIIQPLQWAQLRHAAIQKYPPTNQLRMAIEHDVESIIGGNTISQCFPFSQDEILSGFLLQHAKDTILEDEYKIFNRIKALNLK